jgi:hypothetical protein
MGIGILINRDGSQRLVRAANGIKFSQEEINMYCNGMGCVLVETGCDDGRIGS